VKIPKEGHPVTGSTGASEDIFIGCVPLRQKRLSLEYFWNVFKNNVLTAIWLQAQFFPEIFLN